MHPTALCIIFPQLDAFQFGAHPSTSLILQHHRVSGHSTSSVESGEEVHIISDDDSDNCCVSIGPSIPESNSEVSMHASDFPINSEQAEPEDNPSGGSDSDKVISQQRAEDLETWQEELEQDVSNHSVEVNNWTTL